MVQGEDRRTAPRSSLKKYFVHFSRDSFLARIGLGKKNHASLVNASKAGLQVVGPEQLKVGDRFRFVLKGPGAAKDFSFAGTVSWCKRSTRQRNFFQAGIKFEGIDSSRLEDLQRILDEHPPVEEGPGTPGTPKAAPASAAPKAAPAKAPAAPKAAPAKPAARAPAAAAPAPVAKAPARPPAKPAPRPPAPASGAKGGAPS
ncbi:MAG: PilZ domain-containing protein [Planctomycetes bacterium]|nr:PilZ domain-containing protein [Planctomycetota bacterium]